MMQYDIGLGAEGRRLLSPHEGYRSPELHQRGQQGPSGFVVHSCIDDLLCLYLVGYLR